MAKYFFHGTYTSEGVRGVLKEGGSSRKAVVESAVKGLGGKLEAFYFGLGGRDTYAIVDFPDNISSTALSLAFNSTGNNSATMTVFMSPEEMDEAVKKQVTYRASGQ